VAGIRNTTRQALVVLRHQEFVVLCHTQYCHFLLKETDDLDVHVNDKVCNDPTGQLGEQVCLTMAMDCALTEAMHDIEVLHKRYDE
jgi:hypothetical protein